MSEEHEYIICTSKNGSVCVACELDGKLNCRYDEELVKCFRRTHFPFRALQFLVMGVASFLTGVWWAFILFAVVIALNFTAIESWYLCRHCPFYEKEGKTLECITLKGIPRIWKFDPAPMKRSDKIAMSLVGGFIDIFPILIAGYATWILFSTGAEILLTATMVGLTLISLFVAGYLEKFLRENYCMRCVNLSCMMNKVPEELKEEYLRKNPEMLKVWEDCGYVIGNKT
ncbi:MAG: hypothetical protein ACFFBL_10460 [Promethearchaeota archaeon]